MKIKNNAKTVKTSSTGGNLTNYSGISDLQVHEKIKDR